MTRLLILIDETTFVTHDSSLPARELAEAILEGKVPVSILERSKWCVFQIDGNVIAIPAHHIFPGKDRRLSSRHTDVLNELLAGFSTHQMAERMHLKVATVRQYIRALAEYFGVENREQIVLHAIQRGAASMRESHRD